MNLVGAIPINNNFALQFNTLHCMKLIVDVGNTLTKLALFGQEGCVSQLSAAAGEECAISEWLKNHTGIDHCFMAAVREVPRELLEALPANISVEQLSHKTRLPFTISYKTPETLGMDRVAAVAAAWGRFPGQNVLVIDIGTCITYDILTNHGDYPGGIISPGIMLRFKAMNQFTGKLPLAGTIENAPLTGATTIASLQSGVMNGMAAEINGIIQMYSRIYEDLKVLVGGGDNKYFDKQLNYSIFAASNLVIEGLKVISDFNEYQ